MSKSTLVIGASEKTDRYANIAIHRLIEAGITTYAYGNKAGMVRGVKIHTEIPKSASIHTVTIYISSKNLSVDLQKEIIELKPKRIIFNPGTENTLFEDDLHKAEIFFEHACTLVLLSTRRY
ncbi:MAG: CoA-binding protein [Crocinitomicaceae bacterium]|nr:CoA-binding protein [Crocinitomicaceae bacterium]